MGNYPEGKSLEDSFLGENFIAGSCPGCSCPRGAGGNIQGKCLDTINYNIVFFNSCMSYLPPFPI